MSHQQEHEQQLQQQQQQQQQQRHARTRELAPPQELVAAMQVAPDGGLVAPAAAAAGPAAHAAAGAGGANHQPLPRALRARLAHEHHPARREGEEAAGDGGGGGGRGGGDPHAPLHPPAARLQPLAPQVAESAGAQHALVGASDAEVRHAHGSGAGGTAPPRQRGADLTGHGPGKHVDGAAVGPAMRGVTQRSGANQKGPAPRS